MDNIRKIVKEAFQNPINEEVKINIDLLKEDLFDMIKKMDDANSLDLIYSITYMSQDVSFNVSVLNKIRQILGMDKLDDFDEWIKTGKRAPKDLEDIGKSQGKQDWVSPKHPTERKDDNFRPPQIIIKLLKSYTNSFQTSFSQSCINLFMRSIIL